MTDKTTDTNAPEHANTPLALKLTEGLGPTPLLTARLRAHVPPDARFGSTCLEDDLLEAADEIERLHARLNQQIDYTKLIEDCYSRTKQAQGTRGCVQFARGAEWWREQVQGA